MDSQNITRKYQKISSSARNELLNQIFFKGKKIKKAAKDLNINYSSAKTILHLYRKKFKSQIMKGDVCEVETGYRKLEKNESFGKVKIVSTVGGQIQSQPPRTNQKLYCHLQQSYIKPMANQNMVNQYFASMFLNAAMKSQMMKKTVRPIVLQSVDRTVFE